jgi:hypothetical protein
MTHKNDLVVKHHRPISSANVCKGLIYDRENGFFFQHPRHIGIPLADAVLTSGKMTIDKTY